MNKKPYCFNCDLPHNYRGFHTLPLSKHNQTVWVHICNKPSVAVWESYIDTCEECLSTFSSPWEKLCWKCSDSKPYKGWKWSRS